MFGADRMLNDRGQYCLSRDDGGAWDYFPFGSWGPGYRIGAPERDRLCNIQRVMGFFLLAALGALAVVVVRHWNDNDLIVGIWVVAAFLAMPCVDKFIRWAVVRRLPRAGRRLTATEAYLARVQRSPRRDWIAVAWSTVLFAGMLLFMASSALDELERGRWFMVPLFLLATASFAVTLLYELAGVWISFRLRSSRPLSTLPR